MTHLEYVDPALADDRTRNLLEMDAEYYDAPSLFAHMLATTPTYWRIETCITAVSWADYELDEQLCELVYLAVSVANDCSYCIASHREQLIERVGRPAEEIDAVAAGEYDRFPPESKRLSNF